MVELTDCEKEVCKLSAEGYEVKQIAVKLNKSEATIKKHRSSIMRKMQGKTIIAAIVIFETKRYTKVS
jgi:DNA-binding NarL/FixJ family response regulator